MNKNNFGYKKIQDLLEEMLINNPLYENIEDYEYEPSEITKAIYENNIKTPFYRPLGERLIQEEGIFTKLRRTIAKKNNKE